MGRPGTFQKGHKGGPGRPPILLPEVQRAIDKNKNELKVMILEELNLLVKMDEFEEKMPKVRAAIKQIIDRSIIDGDAVKLKIILELGMGKLVDDPPDFPVTEEEKILLIKYRRMKQQESLDADPSRLELSEDGDSEESSS